MMVTYVLWSYRKDISALQHLDLFTLCVSSDRWG